MPFRTPLIFPLLLLLLTACSKQSKEDLAIARTPKEAASQIDQAFVAANAATKQAAAAASEALRKGDYEQAVVSLQVVRSSPEITVEQGFAIHSSTVAMEARLISAMESGDKNAERAYQLLKAMKKK